MAKKTCLQENCSNPVFSKGYCKWHYKRKGTTSNSVKYVKTISKTSKVRKDPVTEIRTIEKPAEVGTEGSNQSTDLCRSSQRALDLAFYSKIWEKKEHVCYETGKYLGSEPLTLFFHHVLPKAKYPQYRHCEWNIVLLHPDVHVQVETFLDKAPKVKELTQQLMEQYDRR